MIPFFKEDTLIGRRSNLRDFYSRPSEVNAIMDERYRRDVSESSKILNRGSGESSKYLLIIYTFDDCTGYRLV